MQHYKSFLISFLILLLSLSSLQVKATHNRAGEITFKHLYGNTYEVTLTTYVNPESPPERPSLTIHWGDGTSSEVARDSIDADIGEENAHPVQRNVYIGTHTYPGPGTYTIWMRDQNRVADIVNMINSVNTAFYIETQLKIFPGGRGHNSSPVLLQPPIDYAQTQEVYVHYPNAYDSEGDSLAYSLVPPKRAVGEEVNGYYKPYAVNNFSIDPITGRLEWDHPDSTGIYNIAIRVEEYRRGNKIGEVIRDMQIIVSKGNNKKPLLPNFPDTCVEAGTNFTLNVPVRAVDTNPNQTYLPHEVTLTATGGPFKVNTSKASFPRTSSNNTVNSQFTWEISCNHIRKFPYRVVFKAKDDHPEVPLADLRHMDIKVIGPEPENLTTDPQPKGIRLDWDLPACENVKGYKIYRRIDTSFWQPNYCQNGIPPSTGFTEIETLVGKDQTTYFDGGVVPGAVYCYRVTGVYRNQGKYNLTEGYASNEACAKLKKDVPVITHVDVKQTSTDTGVVFIDWSKPVEVDSNTYNPPYKYEIYHSQGYNGSNPQLVETVDGIQSYQELVSQSADTVYYDSSLNTQENPYSYNIRFYGTSQAGEVFIGASRINSSVYLNIQPDHEMLRLSWDANVLWQNEKYVIFRKAYDTSHFAPYDTVTGTKYVDTGLVKDSTYCYYIKSIGSFSAPGFTDPIINHSQISCNEPIDTVPPCPPQLTGQPLCDDKENELSWNVPFCPQDSNITSYNIYFRNHRGKSYSKIKTIEGGLKTYFRDQRDTLSYSLAGCYAVTALDKYNNESEFSNFICVDNCPKYKLPNVFTPNGDGINDYFKPKPGWQFVKRVNLKVFNRWGDIVYKTSKANFKWDGTDMESGKDLSPGTYYYEIEIFEMRLDGLQTQKQSGTIQLIR